MSKTKQIFEIQRKADWAMRMSQVYKSIAEDMRESAALVPKFPEYQKVSTELIKDHDYISNRMLGYYETLINRIKALNEA
jgi:hypothetical protein